MSFNLCVPVCIPAEKNVTDRKLKSINTDNFENDIGSSVLFHPDTMMCDDNSDMVNMYNVV